ncbi:MAG: CrcB family protein [Pirellulaceae bacterium]
MMLVAAGGSLGALARYATGLAAARWLGKGFPWGTLAVNVIGCFVMGMVLKLLVDLESHPAESLSPALRGQIAFWRHGIAIGFLGALTTFSSFGADTIRQLEAGHLAAGMANIAANVLLSLGAVWCGLALMQALD